MCYMCNIYLPLSPDGYRILGLDPSLPIWIHSEISYEFEYSLSTISSDRDYEFPNFHAWMEEKHENYLEIVKSYTPLPEEDKVYPLMAYNMLNMPEFGWKLCPETRELSDHLSLWKVRGRLFSELCGTKVGKLTIPREWVRPQYQEDPLIHKHFDYSD